MYDATSIGQLIDASLITVEPKSSDQAAFRDDTVTGNIFTYSQNNTSHRTFDTQ